ncbi:MAG: NADH-quinone oxidoreductase subunit M [Armatimonadetes bacterium]|nr:NADH-quinone oxidoreductase subunit M [Armatimonadota bacterium]
MSDFPWLSALTFLPLAGALAIMALPRRSVHAIQAVAIGASAGSLIIAIWLFAVYQTAPSAEMRWLEELPWLPELGISYKMGIDGISVPMVLLSGIIGFTAVLMSLAIRERVKEFFALALAAISGAFGVFTALDLFFFILFYELASIPMFFLVGIWGSDKTGDGRPVTRQGAAMKLLIYLQLGGGLVLLGILGLYFGTGLQTFDFLALRTALRDQPGLLPSGVESALFLLLFVGFGIEAGLVPFHTWLPDGHSSAPTPLSMLLAGVLLKMGSYGIIRLGIELLPGGATYWVPLCATLAVINILYGGLCALRQTDIKVMIAYSSVSHMGMVFLGFACIASSGREHILYGLSGAMFQMFSHGVITALLFALAGTVYSIVHTRDLRQWGGLASRMPFFATLYVLGALASLGLPGMTGFVSELMVFLGAWTLNPVLCMMAIAGLIITTTYLLRSVQYAFYGPLNPRHQEARDASFAEGLPMVILAASTLIFGIFPGWMVSTMSETLLKIAERFG